MGGVTGTMLLSSAVPLPLLAQFGDRRHTRHDGIRRDDLPAITDHSVRTLVFAGIHAARSAGASYAEVRLTNTLIRTVEVANVQDQQMIQAGVRALVNGRWGFASGPAWDETTIVTLAQRAVLQAKAQTQGQASASEVGVDMSAWPKLEGARTGHWQMPVKVDPLSVHPFVMQDFFRGLSERVQLEFGQLSGQKALGVAAKFMIQERALGTSEECYYTQRCYLTTGTLTATLVQQGKGAGSRAIPILSPAGQGWELFTDASLGDVVFQTLQEIRDDFSLPVRPATPGTYTVLLDAVTTARVVSQTIGVASELDRALGYEANTGGLSYLNNPAKMLNTFAIGSPLLTVTANRSEPGGAATVQWDDEGVTPRPFTIVKDGVFHDYHLSREGVAWLKRAKIEGREHPSGVVNAIDGATVPSVRTANLEVAPSATDAGETALMAQARDGIFIEDASATMDPSLVNGLIVGGRAYEIKGGKRVARIANLAVVVHTPTLWKSLSLLGGAKSKVRIGMMNTKGEPSQASFHSVTAVPAVFRDQVVTDLLLR